MPGPGWDDLWAGVLASGENGDMLRRHRLAGLGALLAIVVASGAGLADPCAAQVQGSHTLQGVVRDSVSGERLPNAT